MTTTSRRRLLAVIVVCSGMAMAACSGSDGTAGSAATTTAPDATAAGDESWKDDARAWCDDASVGVAAIARPVPLPEDVRRWVEENLAERERVAALTAIDMPAELADEPTDLPGLAAIADRWATTAADQLADGVLSGPVVELPPFSDTAAGSVEHFRAAVGEMATILALAGVPCAPADPARAAQADLNVPVLTAWAVETGFGSVWVAEEVESVVKRIDPDTGAVQAVVDVGSIPVKLHPADGRMVVRTADAYVAIDPATDTVVDTLAKGDVGPAADRSWAVDGALWICDGPRLHRYDPTTLQPVSAVELGFDCGHVYATEDLVIPWTYNQDAGESGASVAAFVDPATNGVLATVDLPVDVGVPVVLDEMVYFNGASHAVVVDRATWTVADTPELGTRSSGGSQPAYDGTSIYVIVEKRDVVVVDPSTFEITETIEAFDFAMPLGNQVNSLAVAPGALWVVNDEAGILQRFDRPT
jgi:glutamine cyclotransferase